MLPFHDHIFAAAGAILIIAGAILGFLWRPGSEIFYVQTLVFVGGPSHRGKTFQLFLRPRPAIGALDFHTHRRSRRPFTVTVRDLDAFMPEQFGYYLQRDALLKQVHVNASRSYWLTVQSDWQEVVLLCSCSRSAA